jgi:hypothetical protein
LKQCIPKLCHLTLLGKALGLMKRAKVCAINLI